jgi:hypothetical protein
MVRSYYQFVFINLSVVFAFASMAKDIPSSIACALLSLGFAAIGFWSSRNDKDIL